MALPLGALLGASQNNCPVLQNQQDLGDSWVKYLHASVSKEDKSLKLNNHPRSDIQTKLLLPLFSAPSSSSLSVYEAANDANILTKLSVLSLAAPYGGQI